MDYAHNAAERFIQSVSVSIATKDSGRWPGSELVVNPGNQVGAVVRHLRGPHELRTLPLRERDGHLPAFHGQARLLEQFSPVIHKPSSDTRRFSLRYSFFPFTLCGF